MYVLLKTLSMASALLLLHILPVVASLDLVLQVSSRVSTSKTVIFDGDSLNLAVQLVDSENQSETRTLELLSTYNRSELHPVVTLANSSWTKQYNFQHMENDSIWWNMTIPRKSFSYTNNTWHPKEEWILQVLLDIENSTLFQKRILVDKLTEPILQWSLGQVVSSEPTADYQSSDQLLVSHSPCTAGVMVVSPQLNQTNPGFHLGVTVDGFESKTTWFYISGQELCSNAPVSQQSSGGVMCYDCYEGRRYMTGYDNCMATQTTMYCSGASECLIEYQVLPDLSIKLTKQCWVDPSPCQTRVDYFNGIGYCLGPNTANSYCAHCCTGDRCNNLIPGYPPQAETTQADVVTTAAPVPTGVTCYRCYEGRGYPTNYANCQATQHTTHCPGASECLIEYTVAADLTVTLTKQCWVDPVPCQTRVDYFNNIGYCFGPNTANSNCAYCCTGDLCNEFIPGYPPQQVTAAQPEAVTTEDEITTERQDPVTNQFNLAEAAAGQNTITEEPPSLGPGCSSIRLLDMKLTNHHLALFTNHGLFVSSDLRNTAEGSQRGDRLQFERVVSVKDGCNGIRTGKFSFTEHCQSRQHDILRGDMLILTYTCYNGFKETLYSEENFTQWRNVEQDLQRVNTQIDDVIDSVHEYHTNSLVTIYRDQGGLYKIESRRLNSTDNEPESRSLYPAYSVSSDVDLTTLTVHAGTQFIYAYGREVWVSMDTGNKFVKIGTVPQGTEIRSVVMPPRHDSFVFVLDNGNVLAGKHGVLRVVELSLSLEDLGTVIYDRLGSAYKLAVNRTTWQIHRQPVDMMELVKNTQILGLNPLMYVPFVPGESYLYEMSTAGNSTSQFSAGSVGQHLIFKNGPDCVIQEVRHPSDNLGGSVLSLIQVFHDSAFLTESHSANIALQILNSVTGESWLIIDNDSDGGFQSSDVNKTVVLVGSVSSLITEYINSTHVKAIVMAPSLGDQERQQGAWFVVNLGFNYTTGESEWYTQEGQCPHTLELDPSLNGKTMFELDLYDQVGLSFKLHRNSNYGNNGQVIVYPSYSNPSVFEFRSSVRRKRSYDVLVVNVKTKVKTKGVSSVRIVTSAGSLLCSDVVKVYTFYTGCPCSKRLRFWYPHYISDTDYLYSNPKDGHGRRLLANLQVNYRPPSVLGIAIPTAEHIYNADPSKPIPNNEYRVSQQTGQYKQCKDNSAPILECGCTDEMKITSDATFSDCKKRVYRLTYPGQLVLNFTMDSGHTSQNLSDRYMTYITEINNRDPIIEVVEGFSPSKLLPEIQLLPSVVAAGKKVYDPRGIKITMNGSGLYHFRVEIPEELSFCQLYAEFQIYIDTEPLAYPMMFIINFTTAFILGGAFFLLYLYYLANHHTPRVRAIGEKCPDTRQFDNPE